MAAPISKLETKDKRKAAQNSFAPVDNGEFGSNDHFASDGLGETARTGCTGISLNQSTKPSIRTGY